jgi:hypothetical protein
MAENPEFAVFLKQIDFIREVLAKRVTLIFRTTDPGFGLFTPDATAGLEAGEIPGVDGLMSNTGREVSTGEGAPR